MPSSQLTISAISPTKDEPQNSENISPNFVLGPRVENNLRNHPIAADEKIGQNILSFFPLDKSNVRGKDNDTNNIHDTIKTSERENFEEVSSGGRVLETYSGEKVFIPTLNIESICSATEASDNFNKDGNLLHGIQQKF